MPNSPCPAHVAVPGGMAVKGRSAFNTPVGWYTSCLLTLNFSALQLHTACLPALGQLLPGMAGMVICADGCKGCCLSANDVGGQKVQASVAYAVEIKSRLGCLGFFFLVQ